MSSRINMWTGVAHRQNRHYYGHMTYFETPTDALAYFAGTTTDALEAQQDAIVADLETLDALGRPDLDPEDRDLIAYADVLDPEVGTVRGYGGDHRRYFPGASGM